ncbi:MAG: hypothetical protein H7834_16420 [Magnetococcus sp. YQC-9]
MTTIARVIRNTPKDQLQTYFDRKGFGSGGLLRSGTIRNATVLLREVAELDETTQAAMNADFERIQEMTDEAGQWAILHMLKDQSLIDALSNPHERVMWLFLHDPDAFRRAEEMRYTDTRRQGRMWSGFVGPRNLVPSQNAVDHRRFEEKVRVLFNAKHAKLDMFERTRPGLKNQTEHLVQAVVYRDGLPDASLEFNALGELELRPHRPVIEVAITYEPITGVIEVVSQGVDQRARLARIFAEVILQQGILGQRIPLRQYDLDCLIKSRDFPSDPEDGIDAVKITWLRLRSKMQEHGQMALISKWRDALTVHEQAQQWIVAADGLTNTFEADEAVLSIRLRPSRGSSWRKQTINVTITLPNGCNLKSKTEKERLICNKYLPRWGLVRDV